MPHVGPEVVEQTTDRQDRDVPELLLMTALRQQTSDCRVIDAVITIIDYYISKIMSFLLHFCQLENFTSC